MNWLQFVELIAIPAFAACVALVWFAVRKAQDAQDSSRTAIEEANKAVRTVMDDLNKYKLDVAREYASIAYLKDVEVRLVSALNEIKDAVRDIAAEMREASHKRQM